MIDVKGDGSHLHEVRDSLDGTRFLQNGPWDRDILCELHERLTQSADDYGTEFCRGIVTEITKEQAHQTATNANPRLLAKFVYQVVWRFCVSRLGRGADALGPYGDLIEKSLFHNHWNELPILASRNHLQLPDGSESTLAIAPFPTRLGNWRFWLFAIGGVHFFLKLDKRPLPQDMTDCLAGQASPLKVFRLADMDVTTVPILQQLMQRMITKSQK
jgi:hypothetical protein